MCSVRPWYNIFILFLFLGQSTHAAELDFTVTGWLSSGESSWAHNASGLNAIWGNPTSELMYENVDSEIIEVSIVLPYDSDTLRFAVGGGTIHNGLLIDDDYVSAAGATYYGATQSGAHRISRTHSDITSSGLYYLSAEYHPGMFRFEVVNIPVQFYAGLQYWKEEYIARGVRQVECTDSSGPPTFCNAVGFDGYNNQTVISNRVNWTTWYVGVHSQLDLSQSMSVLLKINFSPFTYLSNEDVHHLRSDLRQDPSFSMTGFGQAVDLELDWRYRFQDWATVSLGYRYWDRKVTSGDWYAYSNSGTSQAPLNYMRTTRKGLMLGLNVVF